MATAGAVRPGCLPSSPASLICSIAGPNTYDSWLLAADPGEPQDLARKDTVPRPERAGEAGPRAGDVADRRDLVTEVHEG